MDFRRSTAIFEWGKFLEFKFQEFFPQNFVLGGIIFGSCHKKIDKNLR
jgi:hypothetical protein